MKLKIKFTLIMIVFGFAFGLLYPAVSPANAEDAVLVKIHGVGQDKLAGIFINPADMYVNSGTIVIWLNGVKEQEIKVIFEDGKTCKDVTASDTGDFFMLDVKGCYVTNFIPFAATSTLQFTESGTFEYTVNSQDGKIKASGKIIVR